VAIDDPSPTTGAAVSPPPTGGPAPNTGYRATSVVVGAAAVVEDAAAELLVGLRRVLAHPIRTSARQSVAMLDRAHWRMVRLAERGETERERGRRRAADAVDSLIGAVASAAVVGRVVDAQVDRLLRPLVVTVLDDVLALLEEDPERIQVLVRGQRDSMVNDLVGRIRQSAAAGDAAVDRVTARLLRRGAAPAPATPATAPASH